MRERGRWVIGSLRLRAVVFALGAAAVGLWLVVSAARAADSPGQTIALQPGDNLVGWVAEPKLVREVFAEIPETSLIYRWDAEDRRWLYAIRGVGGNLETLEPGMAVMVRVAGDQIVSWERPLTPAKGGITLYAGVNWVTWLGRDEWPLDQVARGIGTSLVSIRVGDPTWPAPLDGGVDGLPSLRRGDAVEVVVNRDLKWLQPTGMMPEVVWAGEPPTKVKEGIIRDIRDTVDYFAESHGVETDFSDTTLLIWHTVEDLVRHQQDGQHPPVPLEPAALRVYLQHSEGWGAIWGSANAAKWWNPNPMHSMFKILLTHEWFHTLQLQYTDWFKWGRIIWMDEGSAEWAGTHGVRVHDGHETFEQSRQEDRRDAAATTATLRSSASGKGNDPWQYQLGLLAIDLLVEASGPDSIIEYYRLQFPQAVGPNRTWEENPTLDAAFAGAFGIRLDDFYTQFESWRAEELPPSKLHSAEPTLHGTLTDASGHPATSFWLEAAPHEGDYQSGRWRRTETGVDGSFSISLLPNTVQRVHFERDGCRLWLTNDGLTTTPPESGQHIDLDTSNLPTLDLSVPHGECIQRYVLHIRELGLRGDDRQVTLVLNSEDGTQWIGASGRPGARTAYVTEAGRYRLRVIIDGCDLWYHDDGLVASRQKAQLLRISEQSISVEFKVPLELCVRRIEGRVLVGGKAPVGDFRLHVAGDDAFADGVVEGNGEFSVTVPDTGSYRLQYEVDGCWLNYAESGATTDRRRATLIDVGAGDVGGIEFVVPSDLASLCR